MWSISTRRSLFTLTHNLSSEVLRASFLDNEQNLICTCGSDGDANIWRKQSTDNSTDSNSQPQSKPSKPQTYSNNQSRISYESVVKISHGETQIYACEKIEDKQLFLTAAENSIYLWNIENDTAEPLETRAFESLQQAPLDNLPTVASDPTVVFGGPRNPSMLAYIFDAKLAPESSSHTHGTIAVGLSDGMYIILTVVFV